MAIPEIHEKQFGYVLQPILLSQFADYKLHSVLEVNWNWSQQCQGLIEYWNLQLVGQYHDRTHIEFYHLSQQNVFSGA
jgi:hypothetical protein